MRRPFAYFASAEGYLAIRQSPLLGVLGNGCALRLQPQAGCPCFAVETLTVATLRGPAIGSNVTDRELSHT